MLLTPNISLHQWEPGDDLTPELLNADMLAIDTAVAGKAATSHPHAHNDLTSRDAAGAHSIAAVTNLQTTLDGKAPTHSHPYVPTGLLTAKGDLFGRDSAGNIVRVPIGAGNGRVLTQDSSAQSGMSWALIPAQDHGSTTGLADDDHLQYLNDARYDARYAIASKAVTDTVDTYPIGVTQFDADASGWPMGDFSSVVTFALPASARAFQFNVSKSTTATGSARIAMRAIADGSNTVWGDWRLLDDHGAMAGLLDDDHTQYLTTGRHDIKARHGSAVVDHGSIDGLGDDDHPHYLNEPRHNNSSIAYAATSHRLSSDHFSATALGTDYPVGWTIFNATAAGGGWPTTGFVTNEKWDNNRFRQWFTAYDGSITQYRTWHSTALWSDWQRLDHHTSLKGLAGDDHDKVVNGNRSNYNLTNALAARHIVTPSIPASWGSYRMYLHWTGTIKNTSVAGTAAAGAKGLFMQAVYNAALDTTGGTVFDLVQQHSLTNIAFEQLSYIGGHETPITAGIGGSLNFGIRLYLGANDNYSVTNSSLTVRLVRAS